MMGWANNVSAAGTAVEIIGFLILGYELRKTNTAAIIEATEFGSRTAHAETISVLDNSGPNPGGRQPGIYVEGGIIGALVASLNQRQSELTESKRLILHGLGWTGLGILVQLFGSIGQALGG